MGQGMDSYVAFGEESTWGTPVAATDEYAYMISDGLSLDPSLKFYPGMRGGPGRTRTYLGYERVAGPIVFESYFQGALPLLLKHVLGATTPTGSDPYTHAFTLEKDLPEGLTVEVSKADVPTGKVFQYSGILVNSLTLNMQPEAMITLEAGLVAKTRVTNFTASGSPSYPADEPLLFHHFGTVDIVGETGLSAKSFSLTINNNLDLDRYFMSRYLTRPVRKTWREIFGSMVVEFDDVALADALKAGTKGTFTMNVTEGTNLLTLAATGNSGAVLRGGDPVVNSEGNLEQSIDFAIYGSDGTDELTTMSLVNHQATIP